VQRLPRLLQLLYRLCRIHDQPQGHTLGQLHHLLQAHEDQRERPRDVVEAVIGEDPGLRKGGYGDSPGAEGTLPLTHLDALVRLDVGPQGDAEAVGLRLHLLQVALQDVEIKQQGRGGQFVDGVHSVGKFVAIRGCGNRA
jgi:hypothetical protein